MSCRHALPLLLLACCIIGSAGAQDDDITIYRCTDAQGRLTLQDSPCAKDQSQQTRRMLQPQDPPPRAAPVVAAPPALRPAPEPQRTVIRYAPRPMYECVRPDGGTYTSDDGSGNPRWVSSAWPIHDDGLMYAPGIVFSRDGATSSVRSATASSTSSSVGSQSSGNGAPQIHFQSVRRPEPSSRPPHRPGHGHGHGHGFDFGYGGGMWVRDECDALPQAEVCSRLRDRREEIRRRFFNAQETERATLGKEERGINARLSEDCGGT